MSKHPALLLLLSLLLALAAPAWTAADPARGEPAQTVPTIAKYPASAWMEGSREQRLAYLDGFMDAFDGVMTRQGLYPQSPRKGMTLGDYHDLLYEALSKDTYLQTLWVFDAFTHVLGKVQVAVKGPATRPPDMGVPH